MVNIGDPGDPRNGGGLERMHRKDRGGRQRLQRGNPEYAKNAVDQDDVGKMNEFDGQMVGERMQITEQAVEAQCDDDERTSIRGAPFPTGHRTQRRAQGGPEIVPRRRDEAATFDLPMVDPHEAVPRGVGKCGYGQKGQREARRTQNSPRSARRSRHAPSM
jgi:hypothetical protein